jgi:hypothetical protein
MRFQQLGVTTRHFLHRVRTPHPDDGTGIAQAGHQFTESARVVPNKFDDLIDATDRAQISTTQYFSDVHSPTSFFSLILQKTGFSRH